MAKVKPVLIVEDDPRCLVAFRRRLRKAGVLFDEFPDRARAEQMLSAGEYSLVLLDVFLDTERETDPDTSGMTLLRNLRSGRLGEMNKDTPVVVLTGYPELGIEDEALQLKVERFASKPQNDDALAGHVLKLIGFYGDPEDGGGGSG